MRKTLISGACVAAAALAGCGSKTPTCADAETVSLVKQIYQQQFDKEHKAVEEERRRRVLFTVKDTQVTLENITIDARNESVGKASCSAQLVTSFPEGAVPTDEQWVQHVRAIYTKQGAVLDGNKLTGNVEYTVQRTEDTGELLVSLSGFMPFMNYFHDIAITRYTVMEQANAAKEKAAQTQASQELASSTQAVPQSEPAATEIAAPAAPQTPATAPAAEPVTPAQFQPVETKAMVVSSLCSAEETPLFACSTGKKRASLCMTGGSTQLVYRLAPLGGAPEMIYPASAATASAAFKQGTHTGSDGQPLPFVSFDKGNYRYAVYGTSATMQGILVEQNGKRIANLNCQADRLSELDTAKLQRLGLSQDQRPLMLP